MAIYYQLYDHHIIFTGGYRDNHHQKQWIDSQVRAIMDDNNPTKESNSQEQTEANYGLSGIPRQVGGTG